MVNFMAQPTAVILIVVVAVFAVAFGAVYIFAIQPLFTQDQIPDITVPTLYPTYTTNPTNHPTATSQPTLTPMRDLTGTWKTSFTTKFNIQIDGSDVGYENRTMTWIITPTNEDSEVNVEVTFTGTGRQLVADSGYTPDVSPMFLLGTISGTRLTLSADQDFYNAPVGEFTFTNDVITGTWHDHWTMLYEQNVYTATDGLVLARQ
jgi:hypothetical protein